MLAGVAGTLSLVACATTRVPERDVPPLALAFSGPVDSTARLLADALRAERVSMDGDTPPGARRITCTYTVREGGIGEAVIRLRWVVEPDQGGASLVTLEAVETDRGRRIAMADRGSVPQRPQSRSVPATDLDALRPVQRVLRRLEAAGGLLRRSP